MEVHNNEGGFTVAEMVVALIVLSIFITLFFQLFLSSESQRIAVVQRATASDIALTNIQKIPQKILIPSTTAACDSTTAGSGNPNNLQLNVNATGSVIATDAASGVTTPTWATAGLTPETLTSMSMPSNTVQTLKVLYPHGCDISMPAQIISIVSYGSETVSRAVYVD